MMTEERAKEIESDVSGYGDGFDIATDVFSSYVFVGELRDLISAWRTVQKLPVTADGVRVYLKMKVFKFWGAHVFEGSVIRIAETYAGILWSEGDIEGCENWKNVYSTESAARDAMAKQKESPCT